MVSAWQVGLPAVPSLDWRVGRPRQFALQWGRLSVERLRRSLLLIIGRAFMKLTHAPGYSIQVITPPTSEMAPTSELIIEGKPTGKSSTARCLKPR